MSKDVDGDVEELLRVGAREHLVLEAHRHKVKQLVHRRLVEPHDGRVREPVKDLPRRGHRVDVLWPEELVDEHLVVHGADDVLEHALRLVERHRLRLKTLREDVDHLAAHVDD